MKQIPFNRPYMTGVEIEYIQDAKQRNMLAGDGWFTKQCHQWLESNIESKRALLTHSCTAALEMAALLVDIQPGDEVIMPSYTFVSTANAFVLRGAVPVFVDIREDTLNIDEKKIWSKAKVTNPFPPNPKNKDEATRRTASRRANNRTPVAKIAKF